MSIGSPTSPRSAISAILHTTEPRIEASEVIDAWRTARKQLDEAIHSYLWKTTVLGFLPPGTIEPSSPEPESSSVWDEMNSETQALSFRMNILEKGRIMIKQIRNRSPYLAPINKLPPEVLFKVFSLSTLKPKTEWSGYFEHGTTLYSITGLANLSYVCTQWRTFIVNQPSFWSHIIFRPDRLYRSGTIQWRLLQLSLDRSLGNPLCITMPSNVLSLGLERTRRGFKYLKPFTSKIKRLIITSYYHYQNALLWFLDNLQTTACSLENLTITGLDQARSTSNLADESNPSLSDPKYGACLLSISSLHLNQASFPWDSPIYQNLVSLSLQKLPVGQQTGPATNHIIAILSASPQLESLSLGTKVIPDGDTQSLASQVQLSALKRLNLRKAGVEGMLQLLPRLSVLSEALTLEFDMHLDISYEAAVMDFLGRVNVTRLVMNGDMIPNDAESEQITTSIEGICASLPNLEYLKFIGRPNSNSQPSLAAAISRVSLTRYEPLCPKLRVFSVVNESLSKGDLHNIALAHPFLQQLHLVNCTVLSHDLLPWVLDEWLTEAIGHAVLTINFHTRR